jgi:N utilization substance protein B
MLYQWEVSGEPFERVVEGFWLIRSTHEAGRAMAERLARGAHAASAELDALLVEHVRNWRIERLAAIDKSLLRLAAYELTHEETPPAVVMDEAVELAKRFGEADSPAFVNGVLDAIARVARKGR